MMTKRMTLVTLSALATSVLFACAPTSGSGTGPSPTAPRVQPAATSLQSHSWVLDSATSSSGQRDTQWSIPATGSQPQRGLEIRFQDTQLSVRGLCNVMNGSYQLNGNNITIDRLASTMMACNQPALMAIEQKVGPQLAQARTWQITNAMEPRLTLTFANGATWNLKGSPTNTTRYGKSEQIFWEVGPQKVACSQSRTSSAQCLQVRELRYDNGLKTATGGWRTFDGQIEGYTHQAGVRNVLRLNRHARDNATSEASRYIYVLDMTVESENVRR